MNNSSSTRGKDLFIFVYLATKSNSSPSLSSTIKRAKLKHNNVFVNKLVNMMRLHSSIYNIILLHVYLSKIILHKVKIRLYKFFNRFI